jgi:hypothetical protein
MKIDNIHFEFDEEIPKELEGKTLNDVFDITRAKVKEALPQYRRGDGITKEQNFYLRLSTLLHQIAKGDTSGVKLGVKSPIQPHE